MTVEKVNKMASEVQEIQSVVHEVGERMITSKLFKNSQSDILSRVSDLQVRVVTNINRIALSSLGPMNSQFWTLRIIKFEVSNLTLQILKFGPDGFKLVPYDLSSLSSHV